MKKFYLLSVLFVILLGIFGCGKSSNKTEETIFINKLNTDEDNQIEKNMLDELNTDEDNQIEKSMLDELNTDEDNQIEKSMLDELTH